MGQEVIYMMTCSPLSHPEDLKPLIKTAIQIVSSPEDVEDEYSSLRFYLAPVEEGIGSYHLMGLTLGSIPHMRLRDILLVQPDSSQDSTFAPRPSSTHPISRPTPTKPPERGRKK
jgi:hypothetical protein